MSKKRIVIVANGDFEDLGFYKGLVEDSDFILCVNGGCGYALAMGLKPDLVIGDLDSLKPADRDVIEKLDPRIIKHPVAKDKSDLELALDQAVEMKPGEILIIGALGGSRVDHAFINILLLNLTLHHNIPAKIVDRNQELFLVKDVAVIRGNCGDYLSLFSLTGEAAGINTKGLRFPLRDGRLVFASTLGLSNELASEKAEVTVKSGLLLAIHIRRV